MKYIALFAFLALFSAPLLAADFPVPPENDKKTTKKQDVKKKSAAEQPATQTELRTKKKRRFAPVTPGSRVVWLKSGEKVEIRPDGTVWWFGVNKKRALVADGKHPLRGKKPQTLVTKGGKLVSPTSLLPKKHLSK